MEIAQKLASELGKPVDEELVWFVVERLSKANLLNERVALPSGITLIRRRELVRRLGVGSLLAVPLVMTVSAPSAVQAATCSGACRDSGQTGSASNCGVCADVPGTCYDNAGCTGTPNASATCAQCTANFGSPNYGGIRSWQRS